MGEPNLDAKIRDGKTAPTCETPCFALSVAATTGSTTLDRSVLAILCTAREHPPWWSSQAGIDAAKAGGNAQSAAGL